MITDKPPIEADNDVATPEINKSAGELMNEIFKEERGHSADLTIMERRPKSRPRSILIGLLVLLILAGISAALGFLVFNKSDKSFNEASVQLKYTGDQSAVSGENVVLKIIYKNAEKAALTDSELNISYPAGFTYVSATSSPNGEYHNQWSIGNLQPGEERTLEISGQLIGEVGSSHAFSAALTYRPANFNSEFSQTLDWEVVVNSSTLSIEVKDAQEVISGQPTTFTIEYTNSSTRDLDRVKMQPTWPDAFVMNSANPAAGNDGNWLINKLKPDQKGTITVTGIFTGNPSDQQEIKIQAGLMGDNGEFQLQLEKRFLVLFISQDIQLNVTVNERADGAVVDWGQTIASKLTVTNSSDFQMDKGVVTWQYELTSNNEVVKQDPIEWSTLTNPQKAEIKDTTLSWSAPAVGQLETFKPGDSLQLGADVNLKQIIPADLVNQPNLAIKITPKVVGQRKSSGSQVQFTKTGNSYVIKINSKATIGMEARYYDPTGVVIGSGPFPPIVGQTTTFKIYLSLTNGANDINDIKVSLAIPESITWVGQGQVDAGQALVFDPKTRLVTWQLNKMPAWTGRATDEITAHFSVSVTPVEEQLESFIQLIPEATFKGTDAFTQTVINLSAPSVDTSLPNDQTGAQRGKVISQGN